MNYLSGRHVKYEEERDGHQVYTERGILVDFYASANEGIYGLVLLPNGSLKQIGVWNMKIEPE